MKAKKPGRSMTKSCLDEVSQLPFRGSATFFSVQNTQHIGPQNTQRFCPLPQPRRHVSIPFPATLWVASSDSHPRYSGYEFLLGKSLYPLKDGKSLVIVWKTVLHIVFLLNGEKGTSEDSKSTYILDSLKHCVDQEKLCWISVHLVHGLSLV